MRTINFRFLGVTMLVIAIASGAAYLLHEFQTRRQADVLLREAESAKNRDDLNLAIDYLERYQALVPGERSIGPLAELGLLLAKVGRVGQAYRTLEAVLRKDSSRDDVRRKLAEVELDLDRFPDAQHHLEVLMKA